VHRAPRAVAVESLSSKVRLIKLRSYSFHGAPAAHQLLILLRRQNWPITYRSLPIGEETRTLTILRIRRLAGQTTVRASWYAVSAVLTGDSLPADR
jgi:hypothetical protein